MACRKCGLLYLDGKRLELPTAFTDKIPSMLEEAAAAGARAKAALGKDPELRIDLYFRRVYEQAYLDGFFRAFSHLRDVTREGRIKRLRALFEEADWSSKGVEFESAEAHREVRQLLGINGTI